MTLISLLILLSCSCADTISTVDENGWREIPAPRPDLQCWTHWNGPEVVCAQSLTSTHGASQ